MMPARTEDNWRPSDQNYSKQTDDWNEKNNERFEIENEWYAQLVANASPFLNFSLRMSGPAMAEDKGARKVRTMESESDRYCSA